MIALAHSGNSANIDYYGEPGEHEDRVWCEVLRSTFSRVDGVLTPKPVPDYYFTVRAGRGIVGEFSYTPKSKPRQLVLPDRTVTRLVRQHCPTL